MTRRSEPLSKTDIAYETLRREILTARLAPGAPLKPAVLQELYGLGWTPLREALSRLEAEHLVTSSRNRGFAVAAVSRAEFEDLQRAQHVVDLPLLSESIDKGDADWESAVITAHFRLVRCKLPLDDLSPQTLELWSELHDAFHEALLSAATSGWLLRFHAQLSLQLQRHHRILTMAPLLQPSPATKRSAARTALRAAMDPKHHTQLMEAAIERDAERAVALMKEHIGLTLDVFSHATEDAGKPSTLNEQK
jgi:DNA-binding GntR family transcriptional regulator